MDNGSSEPRYVPDPDKIVLWPDVSGNTINGRGETSPRQPSPVYWHEPDSIPYGPLQNWFYGRSPSRPKWRLGKRVDKKLSIAACRK